MKKQCTKCRETKLFNEFHKHKNKPDGLQNWCKQCKSTLSSQRYKVNPNVKKQIKARTEFLRTYVRRVKSMNKCQICGIKGYWRLSFHHTDDKDHNIANMTRYGHSLAKIKDEMRKCQLLCHNCHADIHHELGQVNS